MVNETSKEQSKDSQGFSGILRDSQGFSGILVPSSLAMLGLYQ